MEPGEEVEDEEEEEEQRVPPIATTPPRRTWREESLSQSSSETQVSAASGISLGEAIRQRTAANQEIDSWYQLPAEVDASRLTAASDTKLGLASDRNDLTEFPTLEEGVLSSAETSRRQHPEDTVHGLLLDIQDSQFSPCLPLLMYSTPGQRILDETLFQQSERDFIHLRGVPDVSGASEQHSNPLHIPKAAWLTDVETPSDAPSDCCSLSQHPLSFRQTEPSDASYLSQQASCFSKLLMNKEASEDCKNDINEKALIPQMGDKAMNQMEASLVKQTCGTSTEDECFPCDNNVLAPVFELSEKEKELLRRDEFSSSENSSCKTALTKNSGKGEKEMQMEKVKMAESESEGCLRHPEKLEKEKVPELSCSKTLPDDLKKDSGKGSGAQDVFSTKTSEIAGESKERRVDLNDFGSMKFVAVTNEVQRAFLDREEKQGLREEELSPIVPSTSDSAPKQLVMTDMDSPPSCSENAQVEVEPGIRKAELTISDVSIERGHKVRDISPSLNFIVDDGSFFRHFSHPSYQSTPGILLNRNVRAELGARVIKSDVQASPLCLNEDNPGKSPTSTPTSVEKQRSLQCAQKENNKHFDSLKLKYPHTGRIQSLPSLNFMEKVGTWNMSQPESTSDVLASSDQGVISHRKKAYSAIASSANNILSMQNSSRNPKDYIASPSGGTHSLENIHFHNKISEPVHPLTRSQSDNSVNVASKSNSQTDVVQPVNTEAMQPLEGKSNVSGVPENALGGSLVHQITTEIASGSVDKGSSVGQSSYPDAFTSSERVAHLIKEDGNSPIGDQKKCDGLENQKLPRNLDIGHVGMDNFDDISPDSLNLPSRSGESSHGALGSPGCSSVVTKHFFTSAEDDNLISVGATTVLETPEKEELNIEERIPIYLRNLGIDQSPGTILTPFVPRGPIREVEFSPSDLRTLKGSTDTLTRTVQQPQGELLAAVDVIQTSFNSGTSTVSISIPMNSETDSDTFSPRELSPRFSLPFGERPMSQCTVSCHKVEVTAPLSTQLATECSAVSKLAEPSQHLQTVSLDCHSNRESPMLVAESVQDLLAKKESKDVSGSSQRWTASSLAGVKDEKEKGSQTSSAGSEKNKGQESDSVIGSGALQEIRKLLAEAENIAGSWRDRVFSNASSGETESSSGQIEKEDGTKDSELLKDSIPQFQKVMPWAESMNQSSIQEGSIPKPPDSRKDDLKWERSFRASVCSCEGDVEMSREFRTGKSVGRSEPEGCSSVTTDRNQPAVVAVAQSNANSELSTERPSELGNPSSSDPRESVINVPGSFQNKLSKANAAVSTVGGIQESSGSSSGDSLAARVKSLLGNPLMPVGSTVDISGGFQSMMSKTSAVGSKAEGMQESDGSSSVDSLVAHVKNLLGNPSETSGSTTNVPGGFQSVLSKTSAAGSKAGGVQESDGSSSADSLSARVKSLLRNGSPLMPATPILKSADEEERKARAWVKLKLASRSQEAVLDLNEEDRQRIEEIKAELLLSAKRSGHAKGTRSYSSEAASLYSCNQEADKEHSRASSDKRFHSESQTQAFGTKELLEPSLQHVVPLYRAELSDCCVLKNTQLKSLSTAEPPTCSQHQAVTSSHSGCVGLHLPLQKQQDTRVMSFTAASDAQTEKVPSPAQKKLSFPKCSEEMSKQITSITFSSRMRFQSPLTSMVLDGFFSGDDLDEIMPLEMDSATAEDQIHGKQHWERSETCPPSSPALAGSRSNEIAFPADKDKFHVSPDGNRDGAYQETDCLSDRESVAVYTDERQTPSAKNLDTLSQDVTELGRHSARLLGLDCDRKFSQGIKGLHEPHSISSYQQEKSGPTSHVQLCESLEGSDPAIQTDLPRDHGKLLEEEKCPSEAVPLIQKEVAGEQIGASQHSSPDEILSTMSPSSPVKKVLSCVHITLSPKCNNSELHRDLNTENEMRLGDKLEVNSQPVPLKTPETLLEAVPKLPTADLIPEDQRCSSFPVCSADPSLVFSSVPSSAGRELPLNDSAKLQAMSSGGCSLKTICNCTDPAKSRKSTSDATTQITTESPGKTTFSAEIYVNSQDTESSAHQSSIQKAKEFPQNTTSSLNRTSSFPRQGAGQPLLLPYKPSGSTEMYYVPYQKTGAKISSLVSENSGLNDALPSGLPANVLGVQDDKPPDTTAIKHKEGVCCKRAKPKLAWAEEQMIAQEGAPEGRRHLKSVNTTHSAFKSAQFYLHHPVPMCENYLLSHSELSEDSSGVGHTGISSSTVIQNWRKAHRHRRVLSAHRKKDGEREFFPLTAEADYSKNEDLNVDTSLSNETPREELLQRGRREAEEMAACSQTSHLRENVVKDLPLRQRTHSAGSLDELWVKFLERQKRYQQHDFRCKGELTLVERLDRLARVLQNPIRYALVSAKSERNASEKTREVKEKERIRLPEKSVAESTSEPHAARVKERPRINCRERSFVELRKNRSGEKVACHTNEIAEHQLYSDTSSDTCSERRLSKELYTTISSTISESDAVTQTDIETTTQTEVSSTVSTIDTARLVRAFGHRRVQLSPRLSQLYRTIHQQKSRSEKWDEEGSGVRDVEHPRVTSERHWKQKETQALDQALTSSGSWGPSSALSNKRRARMLNKGIQAGDLEIVNGATKKNTRDVGVTFPTPRAIQSNQRPRDPWHRVDGIFGESDGMVTDHQAAGSKGKQKGQPGNFFMEKRTKRSRLHLPQGISWFVQAEDLKFESRKENCSNSIPGPGSSWFEPFTTTKPWREPLREKNFQEQQCSKVIQPAVPERDAETRPIQPFVKLTLQEALAVHRPDFISRSGERVKHLKLVMEERRMQSVLQSEREDPFNPPEKRKGYRNASHVLADRGYLIKEKRRAIPKSEMIQRSKRIYEQLPEVQKKREEEKRKSEYNSYRLKAQLYKMKITNRVLGRKVPWN
ncbi:Alstrom syndrome protein 1 isoform X3 [Phasianus colchicus]|uniref:Alstrom syndrome protein 1 isoform X3 n=1 Tax=Phasianus colchicus TaxID=9054 RepID=UPI00129DE553|nr:Alstrom syndrome protein 1 isoform X3 [Phasianus colchicus]